MISRAGMPWSINRPTSRRRRHAIGNPNVATRKPPATIGLIGERFEFMAAALVEIVRVELAAELPTVTGEFEKLQVAPAGKPEQLRDTL